MEEKVEMPKGAAERPLSVEEFENKFFDCVSETLDNEQSKGLLNALYHLEDINSISNINDYL